jgi:outer membrane biosynthesis protein TonB
VVAASDFRQVQRSSKRLVLISSLASAAAASLVTFALSRGHTTNTAATPVEVPAPPVAAAPVAAPPVAPTAPPSAAPEPAPAEVAAPAPSVEKPKPARKAKAASVAPRPRSEAVVPAAPRDPAAEPNPYDVKLDEEAPSAKPTPAPAATHGSGLEADNDAPQASSSSNASPGF